MAKGKKTGGRDFVKGGPNPSKGRVPLPEEVKALQSVAKDKLIGTLSTLIVTPIEEVVKIAQASSEKSYAEVFAARMMVNALTAKGSMQALMVWDRICGRVPEAKDDLFIGGNALVQLNFLPAKRSREIDALAKTVEGTTASIEAVAVPQLEATKNGGAEPQTIPIKPTESTPTPSDSPKAEEKPAEPAKASESGGITQNPAAPENGNNSQAPANNGVVKKFRPLVF